MSTEICPACGDIMDNGECAVCGYSEPVSGRSTYRPSSNNHARRNSYSSSNSSNSDDSSAYDLCCGVFYVFLIINGLVAVLFH